MLCVSTVVPPLHFSKPHEFREAWHTCKAGTCHDMKPRSSMVHPLSPRASTASSEHSLYVVLSFFRPRVWRPDGVAVHVCKHLFVFAPPGCCWTEREP